MDNRAWTRRILTLSLVREIRETAQDWQSPITLVHGHNTPRSRQDDYWPHGQYIEVGHRYIEALEAQQGIAATVNAIAAAIVKAEEP